MKNIDPRLVEPTPPASTILKFLRGKCEIQDVAPTEFNGQPAIRFCYLDDGFELKKILKESRYIIVEEKGKCLVTLAFKRKKLTVVRGSTFTVPENYVPRGRQVTRDNPEYKNSSSMVRTITERENVLLPNRSYAILRFPLTGEVQTPVVLDVTDELAHWQADGQAMADRANADNLGTAISFEEMRWLYRTALMNID